MPSEIIIIRLNTSLKGLLSTEGAIIAAKNAETGALEQTGTVKQTDYVNINEVAERTGVAAGNR